MSTKAIQTKFGTARIHKGYYIITTAKEGNHTKSLHRLIWEDFYNCEIPEGYIIHHKNGNKTDNCILNLQLMSKSQHSSLHHTGELHGMYGKTHTKEAREIISKTHKDIRLPLSHMEKISKNGGNVTGYFRVSKKPCKSCKNGFTYIYYYFDEIGIRKSITSVNINKLKEKVIKKGLPWKKFKEDN